MQIAGRGSKFQVEINFVRVVKLHLAFAPKPFCAIQLRHILNIALRAKQGFSLAQVNT
jgi:hypothetical protein